MYPFVSWDDFPLLAAVKLWDITKEKLLWENCAMFLGFKGAISHKEAMDLDLKTREFYVDLAKKILKPKNNGSNDGAFVDNMMEYDEVE